MKEFPGGALSAHELEHDVDARVPGHLESVGGQDLPGKGNAAVALEVEVGDLHDPDGDPHPPA